MKTGTKTRSKHHMNCGGSFNGSSESRWHNMTGMIGGRGRGLFTYWNQTRVGCDGFPSLLGFPDFKPAYTVVHR